MTKTPPITEEERLALIETLEQDLANRPRPAEFEGDFMAEMMERALRVARGETLDVQEQE